MSNDKMTPKKLKDWCRNKSNELGISPEIIRRNFFLEKMLELMAQSPYKDNFILKGGFLISSKLGLNNRSTLDLDTTIKNMKSDQKYVGKIFDEIISQSPIDGIKFERKEGHTIRTDEFNKKTKQKSPDFNQADECPTVNAVRRFSLIIEILIHYLMRILLKSDF